jgi:hypothetical protein
LHSKFQTRYQALDFTREEKDHDQNREREGQRTSPRQERIKGNNHAEVNMMEEELFLIDSGTTNSIFRETKYFQTLTKRPENVLTIAGHDAKIVGLR